MRSVRVVLMIALIAAGSLFSSDAMVSTCNVITNQGCGLAEKCTLMPDGAGGTQPACAPEGSMPSGGQCDTTAGGLDDCVGGTYCLDGTCRQFCDPAIGYSCPSGQECVEMDSPGMGWCRPEAPPPVEPPESCNVFTNQGCGPAEKCTLMPDGAGGTQPACAPEGSVPSGGQCATTAGGLDDCVGGTYCLDGTCRQFCDPAIGYSCPSGWRCTEMASGDIALCQSAAPPQAPANTGPFTSCDSHQDCGTGRYCARDGSCHPDSHRPRGISMCPCTPEISNFRSGVACEQDGGEWAVCNEQVDIIVDGSQECVFNRTPVRCNWFGYEFDYEGFDPAVPIECTWTRSMPTDVGDQTGIQAEDASTGTIEIKLPDSSGHYVAPGFENYRKAPGKRSTVTAKFECYYAGNHLFDTQYRFHYFP